jgi:hypothetical protein
MRTIRYPPQSDGNASSLATIATVSKTLTVHFSKAIDFGRPIRCSLSAQSLALANQIPLQKLMKEAPRRWM